MTGALQIFAHVDGSWFFFFHRLFLFLQKEFFPNRSRSMHPPVFTASAVGVSVCDRRCVSVSFQNMN